MCGLPHWVDQKIAIFVKSGVLRAYPCGPTPRYKDKRRGRNRGQGRAIQWLVSHIAHSDDECLIWPFAKDDGHAGCFGYAGKSYKSSRLMCLLAHGAPPCAEHVAAFSCGRSRQGCINPKHMSWKTQSDNQRDQKSGRKNSGRQGKITFADAATIRSIGKSQTLREIASFYDLSTGHVARLQRGECFVRPIRPWRVDNGRRYARIVFGGRCYSLGGHDTEESAKAAYDLALAGLRRGDFALPPRRENRRALFVLGRTELDEQTKEDLRRFYPDQESGWGDGVGRRIPIVSATQEQSSFQLYNAVEGLPERLRDFVLAVIDCEDVQEAAQRAGIDCAELPALLPGLKDYLLPYLK